MNGLKRWICPECADEGYIFAENQEKAKKELGCSECESNLAACDMTCDGPKEYKGDDGFDEIQRELAETESERDLYKNALKRIANDPRRNYFQEMVSDFVLTARDALEKGELLHLHHADPWCGKRSSK